MTRTVLIAGSSRGIGAAAARLESASGSHVILHGRTESEGLTKLAADLDAPAFSCDGQDAHAVQTMVSEVKDRGYIPDALICTLGAVTATDAMTGDTDVWLDEYRANVLAPVNFIRAVAPLMLAKGGGRIVTVSSIRGRDNLASPEVTVYVPATRPPCGPRRSRTDVVRPVVTHQQQGNPGPGEHDET